MPYSSENRITIKDIAEELGVSTATVSNVIHGKTKKISERTIIKVQEKLEESGYIPNMAAVLLAQNSSKIICVVLSDDKKYEGEMIKDPFVSAILNGLSHNIEDAGYFMMFKAEPEIKRIIQYASMWNMAGLILIGYCKQEYDELRSRIHIPFVVIDGYFQKSEKYANIAIDNFDGGYQAGCYLRNCGHENVVFLSDNDSCGDHERFLGFYKAFEESGILLPKEAFILLPAKRDLRKIYFEEIRKELPDYTAAFCASDLYAIEFMNDLWDHGIAVPEVFSVIGFDDIPAAKLVRPSLTTIHQDMDQRALVAVKKLDMLVKGSGNVENEVLPVCLIERNSVRKIVP